MNKIKTLTGLSLKTVKSTGVKKRSKMTACTLAPH